VSRKSDPYLVESAAKVLDVLELFRTGREELTLAQVAAALDLPKSTAFRLLYTLQSKGYLERLPESGRHRRRRRRLGLLTASLRIPFALAMARSLQNAARESGVDLWIAPGDPEGRRTLANAAQLLRSGIELMIVFNPVETLSAEIAGLCDRAGVPVVAIAFPLPGAVTFGVDNYRAGHDGGAGFGQYVARCWPDGPDHVVLLDSPDSGRIQQTRMAGMLDGLGSVLPVDRDAMVTMQARRSDDGPRRMLAKFLRDRPRRRVAVLATNDSYALGALRAVGECGRADSVQIIGQGGVAEVRQELRRPASALWGTVAHFPEQFGRKLMPVALGILEGAHVGESVYTEHALLTRTTLSAYYSA
jgi:ribose transport system substrate-binding protein